MEGFEMHSRRFYRRGRPETVKGLALAWVLVIFIAAETAPPCLAWGPAGHRLTGRLAERNLGPRARAAVAELLEPGETLADASTWADEHRRDVVGSGPWHYVDVPITEPRYDDRFSGPEPAKGNLLPKIREFKAKLKDRRRPLQERRMALRFLVHLVEDLHMPLHVGDNHDRGGNATQVQFFDRGSNMHRVWDSGIIERVDRNEDRWLAVLTVMNKPEARAKAQRGTIEDWATESLLAARNAYRDPATGRTIQRGDRLGEAYLEANLPVVRQRLFQAGVRVAMVLNEVFPED
jgi:hypothetical protein